MELQDLKGIGKSRIAALHQAGIDTMADLLQTLPRSYRDTSMVTHIAQLSPGTPACVRGYLKGSSKLVYFHGKARVSATLQDESGALPLVWFNQPWVRDKLSSEEELLLYGQPARDKSGRITLYSPSFEEKEALLPQYPTIPGISSRVLMRLIAQALNQLDTYCPETLPESLRLRYQLCERNFALRQLHAPDSQESLAMAQRRISFEELLFYQAALSILRGTPGRAHPIQADDGAAYWSSLSFTPTQAQKRVFEELRADMARDTAMRRMVQGDVGCGKTAIAFAAMYCCAQAGYQAALMAPTEILARQHFDSAQKSLAPLGIRCGLLLGGMKAVERRASLAAIASGEWQCVIGTHALLLYGDLDLSIVDELPPGRTPVRTRIVPEAKRDGLYRFIIEQAAQGHQCYIVCPLVEENEDLPARSAQDTYAELCNGALSCLRLGLTYGAQDAAEKERTLAAFSAGEIDVLIATTVIEVGVNVPSATVMVIENADRFGLSQLHQLRGRVGRGAQESWCFLMAEPNERLTTLCSTNDGFEIARKDLELRGPGEFLGTVQHGAGFLSGLAADGRLLAETQQCMRELRQNPDYHQEYEQVLAQAQQRFAARLPQVALN